MDAASLADFLRRRRAVLQPVAVGLPVGRRRRTPGLRREEVANLAGMSCDYYTRLEQARGPRPSRQLLTSLARALRLTEDERDHLFHLVGEEAPRLGAPSSHVRPGVLRMLDRLSDVAAIVCDDLGYVLAWTPVFAALGRDYSQLPDADRNMHLMFFCPPDGQASLVMRDRDYNARSHVSDLRAAVAAHPGDPRGPELVRRLRAGSADFARLWDEHEVSVRRSQTKTFVHPEVGEIQLDCEVFMLPDAGQRLIVNSAEPGSSAEQALDLLRVLGTQRA
ncbi:helix-turn-helix transcriptional regulator [Fodinicola acaciae]|uniref:helix-turn-helix transcriptional regulator n=1 Tax=Fodinicola acaciae TaxID=2681555 RepID=UPI0013D1DC44|nr:helix-turn-helix transcriptional regulator [Fodinicola acaciae]